MMRLLHRVMKSSSQFFSFEPEPVAIDNTVIIPEPVSDGEFVEITDEIRQEEERRKKEAVAEKKRAEEIHAAAEQLVFDEKQRLEEKQRKFDEMADELKRNAEATARMQAEAIIADAKKEAVLIKKKAEEDGFSEGQKEAAAQAEKYIRAAAELISEIGAKKEAYFISFRDELLETSTYIAEKLIAAQLSLDEKTIFSIVAQAAKDFRNSSYLKISLAKCDISEEVAADLDFIRSVVGNIPEIDVEVLAAAESGTVVLDNGSEIIDASVPTQLDLLKEIMENSRVKRTDNTEES